jgi:hypothetical protein
LLVAGPAGARLKHRVPAFEPTDLELEDPRTLELDLQVGVLARDTAPKTRVFVPDFELDLGLTERVELDIDGAFSLDREDGAYSPTADTLWTAVKLELAAVRDDDDERHVWALGAQLGPRLPTAPNSYGTGFGAVLLAARMNAPFHGIANVGGVLEPLDRTEHERSAAAIAGLDLDYDLDDADRFSLLAEVAGAYSLGPDPHDFHTTLGIDYAPSPWLDVSLVGFYGFIKGGDRAGVFVGIAPKFPL